MMSRSLSFAGLLVSAFCVACADPHAGSEPNVSADAGPDASPVCEDGKASGDCMAVCADYRRVVGVRVCQAGRFVCRTPAAACANPSSDAGTPDASATDAGNDAGMPTEAIALSVRAKPLPGGPVYAGRTRTRLFMGGIDARLFVETRDVHLRVEAVGVGHLSDGRGQPLLRNIRFIDESTGLDVMETTTVAFSSGAFAREIDVRCMGSIVQRAGQGTNFSLIADVEADVSGFALGTQFRVVINDGAGHFFGPAAVRDAATGEYFPPAAIENGGAYVGAPFELRLPNLVVRPSEGAFTEQTVVRNAANVYAFPFSLVGGPVRTMRVDELAGTGVGDIGTGFARAAFAHTVTACAIFGQNARRYGEWVRPNEFGRLPFTGLGLLVAPRATLELYLVCSTDSVVESPSGSDRFAVTIHKEEDVRVASDGSGEDPGVVVDPRLAAQVDAPWSVVRVRREGEVSIEAEAVALREYASGLSEWDFVNRYQFSPRFETAALRRVALEVHGNTACIAELGLARLTGEMLASGTLPEGSATLDLTFDFAVAAPDSLVVLARLNRTVPADVAGCHAGDRLSVTLARNIVDRAWDANYAGNWNAWFVGGTSGGPIFVNAPAFDPFVASSSFIVR